ncbi:adenine phosphoribosyltransferase [Bacillota bacterium LX-D]|nr:adenine phosphoribosyltransferase [Bacillota bacterium LX-D]
MDLAAKVRVIPDFPKKGISFKDITTLLRDGEAFKYAIDKLADKCKEKRIDLIVGPEARGFMIGAPLAYALGVGFIPIRKPGKLPGETLYGEYELEYGTDRLEMHIDAIKHGHNVLIVDDLLATGGTISTTLKLIEKSGGKVVGAAFLIELTELKGRSLLEGYDVISLIQYPY